MSKPTDICNRIRERALNELPEKVDDVEWEIDADSIQLWFFLYTYEQDTADNLAAICDEEFGDAYCYVDWDATETAFTIWYERA